MHTERISGGGREENKRGRTGALCSAAAVPAVCPGRGQPWIQPEGMRGGRLVPGVSLLLPVHPCTPRTEGEAAPCTYKTVWEHPLVSAIPSDRGCCWCFPPSHII